MGTQKRERQKANRQQRLIEEARAERTGTIRRNAIRWTMGLVAAIGAVVLIAWVGGAFDGGDDPEQTEITLPPIDTQPIETQPVDTTPVPPKPEVEVPAEMPGELVVTELSAGDGPVAEAGDTVLVHYVGVRTEDGTEFDNSYDRGQAFPVSPVGSAPVIQGWNDGLVGAQEGSRIQLDIPADLAYGDTPPGDPIQPGDALTFVIDVISVTKAEES